jgi:hypothetical protein
MQDDRSVKDKNSRIMDYTVIGQSQLEDTTTIGPNIERMVGDRLKQYYSGRLSQPLPDKFADLLKELAKKEAE